VDFLKSHHAAEEDIRARWQESQAKATFVSYVEAGQKKFKTDWKNVHVNEPRQRGVIVYDSICLDEVIPFIDWSPFFWTWGIQGMFPKLFDSQKVGHEAQKLFADAQQMLEEISRNNLLAPKAVLGFWPAQSAGDDVLLFKDDARSQLLTKLCFLRQQRERSDDESYLSLADFVAPEDSNRKDWLGAFVVTAGAGVETLARRYEDEHDDYSAIMVKALGDRIAEALAEMMHRKARVNWGFEREEQPLVRSNSVK
jgi:5-methyltetrahydrofolate--homocysteine methyltransferase